MNESIIKAIDKEITSLQQARAILAGTSSATNAGTIKRGRGRPKGSKTKPRVEPIKARRVVSEETRHKMAASHKQCFAPKKRVAKKNEADAAQNA